MRLRYRIPFTLVRTPAGPALLRNISPADFCNTTRSVWTQSDPFAVVKPERVLGAPWMDDAVANGTSVALCEDCSRRYGRWWAEVGYLPEMAGSHLSDCEGCSKRLVEVTVYYPEARFANQGVTQ